MITIPTVLILGAGASNPYGFPVARDLRDDILRMLTRANETRWQFRAVVCASDRSSNQLVDFRERLRQIRPASVDAWIGEPGQEGVQDIGKAAIAARLFELERQEDVLQPKKPVEDWYQVLWEKLSYRATFETFQENCLTVVTFNYDRSFEEDLFIRMKGLYCPPQTPAESAAKLTQSIPIVHVYGSLGLLPWQQPRWRKTMPLEQQLELEPFTLPYNLGNELIQQEQSVGRPPQFPVSRARDMVVSRAMRNIKIIPARSEKPATTHEFNKARQLIESAKALYYIGFGYNLDNIECLGTQSLRKPRKVMGTTLGIERTEWDNLQRLHNAYDPRDIKDSFPS
ncbi:MAG: hypothetical protein ACYS21_07800, partial [Planctomycetota bacterium]